MTHSKEIALMFSAVVLPLSFGALANLAHGAELDAFGRFKDIEAKKTGFFHAEKIDVRWWLVTPDGHGFWGVGMAHPITDFTQSAVTFTFEGDQDVMWINETMENLLQEKLTTRVATKTDDEGRCSFRGFHGTYDAVLGFPSGEKAQARFEIGKDDSNITLILDEKK